MKIGINALFYQQPFNGSAQYLSQLVRALQEIDQHNVYLLFGPQPITLQPTFPYRVRQVPTLARKNENIEKVFWEQITGPAAARAAGVDLFHVPYFASPLFPQTPTVVSVQDIIPLRLPAYQGDIRVKLYMQLVARATHNASKIITISQHAKRDIIDRLHIPEERIRVIYQAAGDEYRPITDPDTLARVRARYGIGERYIFYLGGLDHRKNVPQLVRAFVRLYQELGDPQLQLLVSGNPEKQKGPLFPDPRPFGAELEAKGKILYRFVEDEDKPAIMSGASLFVYPSAYEGFGLPPLEALCCGAPVACSNRTSLPEVVGDAALTFDPDNLDAFVETMKRGLTDETVRSTLRERARYQTQQFSWKKTAEATLAVYEEVYATTKRRK
ncbi:glycosyltransferase involved in cell wall biosynthesis [Thermosporothrix hazakensis]|jgi:glycosyltransferase involved in cell wall biosynthesis|uniref:Glycosyltransferase involved in cell wall biosynthesis n=2 Tax=Thermosporothrix TaxID=768650 RepID=A0A326U2C5_THEHA|nr:glycosyltransferase family 1 protein [Thermosporothrix hazakensis]PZW25438.1 glycosyltransferase involved in cell wall biosynthesis [Thermosporothrix hazakensis]BBH90774.1 glycosyl transferase family 1 [Thermosporothrix sp. COM3]GCE48823.1 glycosyl transferase family 1 [Thermosporothrix hazakensis]